VTLWRVSFTVPAAAAQTFAAAIEGVCDSVGWFGDEADALWRVEGHADHRPDADALHPALTAVAATVGVAVPAVVIDEVPPRDWAAESQADFAPFRICRFTVQGTDENAVAASMPSVKVLRVDAGAAFGTGRHASTAGCLLAMERLAERRVRRVPDMGCGTGILALAAARLWPTASVLAADCDPVAVAVAVRTVRANGLGRRVRLLCADGYAVRDIARHGPYNLIVSNILAGPLAQMAGGLAGALAPGGTAVLGGFLAGDDVRVLAAHRAHGLRLVRRDDHDGWRTLTLSLPAPPASPRYG